MLFIFREILAAHSGACERVDFTHELDYCGNRWIAAPKFSVASGIDFFLARPNLRGRETGFLAPRFPLTWKGSIFFDACSSRGGNLHFPEGKFGQGAVSSNARQARAVSPGERLQILLWVQKLTDPIYRKQAFDQSGGQLNNIRQIDGDPGTFGLTSGVYSSR